METPTTPSPQRPRILSPLGLELTLIGRGTKPGEIRALRKADGAFREYLIGELRCEGGVATIEEELGRVEAERSEENKHL